MNFLNFSFAVIILIIIVCSIQCFWLYQERQKGRRQKGILLPALCLRLEGVRVPSALCPRTSAFFNIHGLRSSYCIQKLKIELKKSGARSQESESMSWGF